MPRLLQIDSCLGILSTGRISEGIAKVATAQGWECYIAHGARFVGKSNQVSYQIESKKGEYVHYLKSFLFDAHGLGSKKATRKLIRFIEQIHPDVIQMHCIHGYYLNYKVLFEYLGGANIPVVWTQHDCWGFTGHCSYFGFANCEKWKDECHDCPLLTIYPRALIDNSRRNFRLKKQLFSSVANMTVVSVSKWLDTIVAQSFLKNYPHGVIYNGIDTDVFRPYNIIVRDKYDIVKEHYLLAVSTVWTEEKGLNDYIKLNEILPADYCIVMVGVDDETRKKLPVDIVAIPRTDNKKDLAILYSDADFVLSLSHSETFGLTVVEGMSCGTPAIVYNNTAQPEIVTPEVGYVVPMGAFEEILDILKNNRNINDEQKEKRASICVQKVNENFNDQEQYKKYVGVYNALISNSYGGIFSSSIYVGGEKRAD